jgi:hypothetical protein
MSNDEFVKKKTIFNKQSQKNAMTMTRGSAWVDSRVRF